MYSTKMIRSGIRMAEALDQALFEGNCIDWQRPSSSNIRTWSMTFMPKSISFNSIAISCGRSSSVRRFYRNLPSSLRVLMALCSTLVFRPTLLVICYRHLRRYGYLPLRNIFEYSRWRDSEWHQFGMAMHWRGHRRSVSILRLLPQSLATRLC